MTTTAQKKTGKSAHTSDGELHRREKGVEAVSNAIVAIKSRFGVSAHAELDELEKRRGKHSWQAQVVHVLHAPKLQVFFIVLLLLDVMIVFVELFLDAEYPRCYLIERDATSCCNISAIEGRSDHRFLQEIEYSHRFLASGSSAADDGHHDSGHHALCEPYAIGMKADCDTHKHAVVHELHVVLYACSVSILAVFAVELILLLVSLGSQFWYNLMYVIDIV
eukprot:CAMPEP_0174712644 /NCGR_PEP_ID=MMETSP1094-20130205/13575_1 /TAXON_ID=156173 /ORGANISM="Chrysochromulina brevifilum, Strain UTEX LB 985" /LENGTH=220 /DNA_ID=CAMNT_0015911733 /DNA_START=131 /DNA_END=789 /DNA_ORIENTATION=-